MQAFTRYEDIAVGDVFPAAPMTFEISAEKVDAFLQATGNTDPAYQAGQGMARSAPSMLASAYLVDLLKERNSPPGGIHAKQSIRFHRGITVGETLTLQARVTEKYLRRDRPYVVSEFEARGPEGAMVASGRITTIWGVDA